MTKHSPLATRGAMGFHCGTKSAAAIRQARFGAALFASTVFNGTADAQVSIASSGATPTPTSEVWWTGPVAAASPNALPKGHVLIEPYVFDARSAGSDYLGSSTYILAGFTDELTVGLIPTFGGIRSLKTIGHRRLATNDLTLTAQWRVHRGNRANAIPVIALVIQRTLPLGRYDRLGGRPERGIGTGTHATVIGVYAQRMDVLANGRPLRTRLNLTRSFPWRGRVRDESVFGTHDGFAGRV